MSGGWVRFEAAWWEGIRDRLPRPLSREEALADLRWLADRDPAHEVPSRRQLAAAWGWTDGEVRGLLRRPDEWWDPMWGPVPRLASPRPPDPPRTQPDPPGPSTDPPPTEEPPQSPPPDPAGPSRTQPDPARTTGAVIHPAPSPARVSVSPGAPPLQVLAREGDGLQGAAAALLHGLLVDDWLAPTTWRSGRGNVLRAEPELFAAQLDTIGELVRQCELERIEPADLRAVVWRGERWPRAPQLVRLAHEVRLRREEEAWQASQLDLPEPLPDEDRQACRSTEPEPETAQVRHEVRVEPDAAADEAMRAKRRAAARAAEQRLRGRPCT